MTALFILRCADRYPIFNNPILNRAKNNPRFAIVIRADKDVDYGRVIELIDKLKGAGITRFGLATDGAGK